MRMPSLLRNAFICSLLLIGMMFAQGQSNRKLEVHILLSTTGEPVTSTVRVQVLDLAGTPISEAYTNRRAGVAEFQNSFAEGDYRLLISGADIESLSTSCEIYPTETEHREYVRVKPVQAKRVESVGPDSGNQPISVETEAVPKDAREDFNK